MGAVRRLGRLSTPFRRGRTTPDSAVPPPPDRDVLPAGYARVLHHHVRKTAGTSLNAAFYRIAGYDYAEVRAALDAGDPGHRPPLRRDGLTLNTDGKRGVDAGAYFFASSHAPTHRLHPPPGTFRLTILRDPARRLVSHYRYLRHLREFGIDDGPGPDELAWADGTFAEFVEGMPRHHRDRQLFLFSAAFDVDEATAAIDALDAVLFTETFTDDLAALGARLGLPLEPQHQRSFPYTTEVTAAEVAAVGPLLDAEYDLVERVARRSGHDPGAILGRPAGA